MTYHSQLKMEKPPRCRSRVTPENNNPTQTQTQTKRLPNGDIYSGTFLRNNPDGVGTYIWKDGCKYTGEWRNGKACGKGVFVWGSGARYEGEFKDGRMNGRGVLVGSGGDCYSGGWVSDRKEGSGEKWFLNGDYYCGEWLAGLMDGFGKYVWKDGGFYFGEWRAGRVFGGGVLVLEGSTRASAPPTLNFEKCSFVDGDRYKGEKWYKSSEVLGNGECKLARNDDGMMGFPRICIWESEGDAGDITCDIVGDGFSGIDAKVVKSPCCFIKEAKKPGSTISKGHKNYDLMLNLQLGIRYLIA